MDSLHFGDFNGDGRTDIFRRDPQGQWWIVSPGVYDWEEIQSSGFPLSDLRFGDFNGDRITDVVAVQNGRWSVSWGGRSSWERINSTLGNGLSSSLIGDIDQNGIDDVLRYGVELIPKPIGFDNVQRYWRRWTLEVSWDGCSGWSQLHQRKVSEGQVGWNFSSIMGRFRGTPGEELLEVDSHDRKGRIFDLTTRQPINHSLYAY